MDYLDEMLMHYGMPRRSGRYPYGSGDDPYQRACNFYGRVVELEKQGLKQADIAKLVGCKSSTELRSYKSIATNEMRMHRVEQAKRLMDSGMSKAAAAREMGVAESTFTSLLNARSKARTEKAQVTADLLRSQVDEKGMIDVGSGIEKELGISRMKLDQALVQLKSEGYEVHGGGVPQATNPGKQTILRVLCPPGTKHSEIYEYGNIHSITDYRVDESSGTDVVRKAFQYPSSISSDRVSIRYAEDGGTKMDGVIELRRGVKDLSLGNSHYAQVRIMVDGTHYLKGMALYSDDLPDGVDVRFNTNKTSDVPKCGPKDNTVLKPIKSDPDNPFGALVKEKGGQSMYIDDDGTMKLSAINKCREEGDWGSWSDSLPSQFLSKQPMQLINQQLKKTMDDKQDEYNRICEMTNPTVKKKLLDDFAEGCDSDAVHLQAAALPRQKYQVILPMKTLGDNEVYAPNYKDGETVALIRYPHGGTFEIPILKVNNSHKESIERLGKTPVDAIGINSKVAERLSGADFDGDTVMVIPCNSPLTKTRIVSTPALADLEGFDPKMEYRVPEGNPDNVKLMTKANTQMEMGKVSNLITDMTLKGATTDELARAVKHSMVVIDAEKHKLDYQQSYVDNGIAELKRIYQGRIDDDGSYHEGASTLISRAKSPVDVTKRKGQPKVDPETGKLIYKEVHEEFIDPKTGKVRERTQGSRLMAETEDARKLSSGTMQEEAYAEYANFMKGMANDARKESLLTKERLYDAAAAKTYAQEVASLEAKLSMAQMNAPKERQAQLYAASVVKAKQKMNPEMTNKEKKKIGQQALAAGRAKLGAHRTLVDITDREWEAIQAGAVTKTQLGKILDHADGDRVRELAMPRPSNQLSSAQQTKIASMRSMGYTTAQIASSVGCSASTVSSYILGKGVS